MQYSVEEIKQYAAEEDVKFIRMAFCDAAGRQKNIAIMPEELDRAFQYGIAIDGSAIPGFGGDSLKRSLDGMLSLGVQHISAYHLTVEPQTAFGRRMAQSMPRVR